MQKNDYPNIRHSPHRDVCVSLIIRTAAHLKAITAGARGAKEQGPVRQIVSDPEIIWLLYPNPVWKILGSQTGH